MELLISAPPRNLLLIFGTLLVLKITNVITTNESSIFPSFLNATTDAVHNVAMHDEEVNNVSAAQETSTIMITRRKVKYEMKASGLGVATWKEISLTRNEDINYRQGRSFAGQQVSSSSNLRHYSVWIVRTLIILVAFLR